MDEVTLPEVGARDVRFRTLAVSAEHNLTHAATADTVNITDLRGGKIFPGNSAVGEVIEVGPEVTRFQPGDIVLTHCNGEPDDYGYPLRIWAYDQPESIGWYAEECVVGDWQLVRAPLDCGLNLWEIAALPLRAPTAYHMWRRAEGILRVKISNEQLPTLNVLAFGGGVSELFLMLAKHRGHNAFFCSGSPERRAALADQGIASIDQKAFNRFASRADIKAFGKEVKKLTNGTGMHIVCDLLRGPCFDAGISAAARQGVNVSAGWQLGTQVTYNSAGASTKQITLDHTHYETPTGVGAATDLYGKVFKPTIHSEIYAFEDLPRAIDEMDKAVQTGIPIIRVADAMPAALEGLIP
jgi:NADPH:quinone reductase-like Zn-dependent oxidoreductase